MFDQPVRGLMRKQKLLKAPPETTVVKAARLMAAKNVGAVIVVAGTRIVGIFTERDLAFRVVAKGLDVAATPLSAVMTPSPQTIAPDKPFGSALLVMHESGFRHLPVVEKGKLVGIVSARYAMDPDLEEFTAEAERREYFRKRA